MSTQIIPENEINGLLEKFESENGIPSYKQLQSPIWLEIPLDELKKKTPQELTEASIELHRFALSIERLIGKHRAWIKWAKSKLDEYQASNLEKMGTGYGWNERMLIARTKTEECKKLNQFIRTNEMKLERLYQTPQNVRMLSDCIKDLKWVNIHKEKDYNA